MAQNSNEIHIALNSLLHVLRAAARASLLQRGAEYLSRLMELLQQGQSPFTIHRIEYRPLLAYVIQEIRRTICPTK